MRIDDEFYSNKSRSASRIVIGCIVSLMAVTCIGGTVLYLNKDKVKSNNRQKESVVKTEETALEGETETELSKLTSDDLDFWHMYDKDEVVASSSSKLPSEEKKDKYDLYEEKAASENRAESASENKARSLSSNSVSENSFNASDTEEPEYVDLIDGIVRNNYAVNGFRQENQELQYYSANRKISSFGIDVSKYQGVIDWAKVKESNVEFAMIRMGVRGYSSGNVVIDETFKQNIEGAIANGINVGIYFYSQAINEQEAIEEANYAVSAAMKYAIDYPIVCNTEEIRNDSARTDNLSKEQLSLNAKAFCDTVRGYGYKAMICGTKHQLASRMDLTLLSGYDIWLEDAKSVEPGAQLTVSEYPYQYSMWQYSSTGKIDGVDGDVDLDISFVDYKYR